MSKIKKIAISAMLGMMTLLGIATTANAYYVGQNIDISYNQYVNNGNIYCVEHHQALKANNSYTIISQVRIEGNKSTDHTGKTQTSWHNAKLAYILSQNNGSSKSSGPVANAIWNYMYTWLRNVGQNHAGLYAGFSNGVAGSATSLDTTSSNYANNLGDTTQIKDNTNKSNIKVVAYQKDNNSYMRVGPFNWSFPGTMQKVTADDQDGKQISGLLYSSFNGNNESWYGVDGIKSGKDFYISVPMDTSISKITKITGQAKATQKGVNIWFLQAKAGYKQNLIIREPYEAPVDITTTFDYNISTQGHLKVIKVNKDNQEFKLPGVGFYIQHKETGKYVKQAGDGKISYVEKAEATEFITDSKGEILVKNLIVGTYVAYETKNPNYGYEFITDGQEKEIVVDKTTDFTIPNKQIYVKLSGYVWVDKADGKGPERNDLYKNPVNGVQDANDILFNGIKVRLKDRTTGQTVMETVTSKLDRYKDSVNDGNGEYLFMDVLIEKLKDYYIEFEYDGLTYTNVVPYIEQDRGSKAAESEEERDNFNKNFSVVEGESKNTGFTRDANGNRKHDLSYHIDEVKQEATLINNGQYTITANTDVPNYKVRNHFTYGQEEVKYINLGLYERSQPDIALGKDLENVKVAVNGYEHTYFYRQRYANQGEYTGTGFNVGVKFKDKYSGSYTRAIYKSDYEYINEEEKDKELKVYITYEIKMLQANINLRARVNSIVDYFDSNYDIVQAGTGLNEKGEITGNLEYTTPETYNQNYKKVVINNHTDLEPQKENSIYVQFALNREAVIKVLNGKENLDNVAEVNSYSIFDAETGKVYAGIDHNSNPGNAVPEDKQHENDTATSPALTLELADAREMAGKVFLDETSGELMTGKVRQGSGAYEEGEKGIEGVDITLTENTGSGKVYTAKTDANGDFFIANYIPGDYTLTYTWGDKTYTVQDYKGTIYDSTRDQNNKNWYKENVETRLSDAMDNYQMRLKIDDEIKKITNGTTTTKEKMDSTTPTMGIGVEYETTYTASAGDKYTYRIQNVDFGIVERARQDLALTKRIKSFKVTLANGQVISNVTIEEDEKGNRILVGDRDGITYMKPDPNTLPGNGFIRLELDNELIQGATLEVGYEIKATNQSELDYRSENFYQYGKIEGEVVTIEPTSIIDYLDKNWSFDGDKNTQWQVKTFDDIKDLVAKDVYESEETMITDKKILYTESLKGQNLKPTDSAAVDLTVSKILTTTDEISLDNEVEMLELNKTGGAKPESIPGNYVPGKGPTETDDSMAETAIVTPATGENQNYILPVIVGVTAFVILGAGVIIIKKKVI